MCHHTPFVFSAIDKKRIEHVDFSHQWGINFYIRWLVINALYLSMDYLIMNKLRAVNKKRLDLLIVQMQKSDKRRQKNGGWDQWCYKIKHF